MKTPKIKFIHTAQTELFSLLSYFYRTKTRFYLANQYYVLPYLIPKNKRTVFLPDIELLKKKTFIKLCDYYDYEILDQFPNELEDLLQSYKFDPIKKHISLTNLNAIFSQFCKKIDIIFPSILEDVTNIIIMPTRYGTACSEYSSQSSDKTTIRFFVRTDTNIDEIFYMFLMERINRTQLYTKYTWEERMAICEHTMQFTSLKNLFPNFKSILSTLSEENELKLLKESREYHKKLGIKIDSIFLIKNNDIYINSTQADFTLSEKKVLRKLIEEKNQIVTFESIAEVMWEQDSVNKYSLYAMSKCIERIRNKLKQYNIHPQILETHRLEGYRLVD